MKGLFFVCALTLVLFDKSYALPGKVIIIRHAEKNKIGESLNPKGVSRASALPYYFAFNPLYNDPSISFVFAAKLYGPIEEARTYQTCSPTAEHYGVGINTNYINTQVEDVAREILTNPKYDQATILLCWTHGKIARLVKAFGGPDPGKWQKDTFDQVYILNFKENATPSFHKELQQLMYGDRSQF